MPEDSAFDALIETSRTRRSLPTSSMARAIREQAGLSQKEFADELGVTRPTVSRYESGLRSPRGENLKRYSDLLATLAREVFG